MPRTKFPASRQTKLKIKKGFVNAPITYEVLMVHQLKPEDKKIIEKGLALATTPDKAATLVQKPEPGKKCFWTLKMVSLIGTNDIRVLAYKNLEVAVFVKRQTSKVTPEPEDPSPEGVLENAEDVWARVDLFIKSPRQLLKSVQEELEQCRKDLALVEVDKANLKRLHEADERTIKSLQGQLKTAQQPKRKK